MCRWDGGGGVEIPKGGRAGSARSLGIWPRGGGEIPRDLAPGGGRYHGGAKSLGHRFILMPLPYNNKFCGALSLIITVPKAPFGSQ